MYVERAVTYNEMVSSNRGCGFVKDFLTFSIDERVNWRIDLAWLRAETIKLNNSTEF